MKQWIVSYSGKSCSPDLHDSTLTGNTPQLIFIYEGIPFSVEFKCQSDYFVARDSSIPVDVMVISANRTKRFNGTIIHKITCYGIPD